MFCAMFLNFLHSFYAKMFEAKLAKASTLKKIVSSIKDLITDVPLECTENALELQAMDGSHVALIYLHLGSDLFDAYRCDRSVKLGLPMKHLVTALKCSGSDDSCHLRFNDTEESVTMVLVDEKHRRKQDITLKLMDIDQETLGIPDQKYTATIDLPSSEFSKLVGDLSAFSDCLTIKAKAGEVQFESQGGENGGNVVTYTSAEEAESDEEDESGDGKKKKKDYGVQITVTEPTCLSFSTKYLTQFSKASKLSDRVRLSMSSGVPIVVEYQIEDAGYLKFYLAPKIEDDEMGQ
ncbi:Proliferating cell nuclear antigen [Aphelenchoides bicaudatus]|nr:Proliferating cell nuclear antigen [Aphelenchoides bicaudatus]